MEGKKTPSSRRKSEDSNSQIKQAEDSFYSFKYAYTPFDEMKEQGEYNMLLSQKKKKIMPFSLDKKIHFLNIQ